MIFQDITALKQLQHLRQDFMGLVAHDLRTPLQSVLLQLESILQRAEGEAASGTHLRAASDEEEQPAARPPRPRSPRRIPGRLAAAFISTSSR